MSMEFVDSSLVARLSSAATSCNKPTIQFFIIHHVPLSDLGGAMWIPL